MVSFYSHRREVQPKHRQKVEDSFLQALILDPGKVKFDKEPVRLSFVRLQLPADGVFITHGRLIVRQADPPCDTQLLSFPISAPPRPHTTRDRAGGGCSRTVHHTRTAGNVGHGIRGEGVGMISSRTA